MGLRTKAFILGKMESLKFAFAEGALAISLTVTGRVQKNVLARLVSTLGQSSSEAEVRY